MISSAPSGPGGGRLWSAHTLIPSARRALRNVCLLVSTLILSISTVGLAPAQVSSADRMVAEWMVRMGGSVVLEGQRRPITDLADLPDTPFRIHTLNFTGITQWGFALEDE